MILTSIEFRAKKNAFYARVRQRQIELLRKGKRELALKIEFMKIEVDMIIAERRYKKDN